MKTVVILAGRPSVCKTDPYDPRMQLPGSWSPVTASQSSLSTCSLLLLTANEIYITFYLILLCAVFCSQSSTTPQQVAQLWTISVLVNYTFCSRLRWCRFFLSAAIISTLYHNMNHMSTTLLSLILIILLDFCYVILIWFPLIAVITSISRCSRQLFSVKWNLKKNKTLHHLPSTRQQEDTVSNLLVDTDISLVSYYRPKRKGNIVRPEHLITSYKL